MLKLAQQIFLLFLVSGIPHGSHTVYTVGKKTKRSAIKNQDPIPPALAAKEEHNKLEAERKKITRCLQKMTGELTLNPITGDTQAQWSNVKRNALGYEERNELDEYVTAVLTVSKNIFINYPLAAMFYQEGQYTVYRIKPIPPKKYSKYMRLLAHDFEIFSDKASALSRLEEIKSEFPIETNVLTGQDSNAFILEFLIKFPNRALWKIDKNWFENEDAK